jgi:endoglucanase
MKIKKFILPVMGIVLIAASLPVTNIAADSEKNLQAGIAALYPNDAGISGHPDVIIADNFDSYSQMPDLRGIWSTVNEDHMNLCNEPENTVGTGQSLQLNIPEQNIERYTGLDLYLPEKQDTVYIRYYQKIDESYAIGNTVSNHNGGSISGGYWTCGDDSGPGICSNGTNKFLADLQSTQSTEFDGHSMMVYTYHPDMRYNDICPIPEMNPTPRGQQYADHLYPDGEVMPWTYWKGDYGEDFIPRPKFNIELGQWYCYELMLKTNTPGQRDGRLTAWVDGEIIMDFGNMRFRDIADLQIDLVGFTFGCASSPTNTKSWFDNIVVAKSYIGPVAADNQDAGIKELKEELLGINSNAGSSFDADANGIANVFDLVYVKKDLLSNLPSVPTVYADFEKGPSQYFHASDGWTNGSVFDCVWRGKNAFFADGALNLTIDEEPDARYNYSAAEYRTYDFYHYGYYETSMQAIKNDGVVSSFFTYTGETDGNPWDEIDIEILGKDTTKVQFNYFTNGNGGHEYFHDLGFDASEGFHTYGFDWQPDSITWYVDGEAVHTATADIPVTPARIMMNVWPGTGVDGWLNPYDGNTPLTAKYQWVSYDESLH